MHMPGYGRGARNHFPGAAAMRLGLAAIALGLGMAPLAPGPARAQFAAEVPAEALVQRGVPAEATAENGVVARERALAAGQRTAYARMASALGLPTSLPDRQIEELVQSLVIESERITPTRYIGQVTVNFSASRVAALRSGGTTGGMTAGAPATQAAARQAGPAVSVVEAVARYRSFPEWVEISRRLSASPQVARVDVVSIAPDMARLRLALRAEAPDAAAQMAQGGLALTPATPPMPGEGWRLSLGGR